MKAATVKRMIQDGLDVKYRDLTIEFGPQLPQVPDQFVLITPYGGSGSDVDGLMDLPSFQIRVVGKQEDYDSAEDLAQDIDTIFVQWFSKKVGPTWVTSIVRVGGPPSPLEVDDSDRHHFVCSYTATVESAVA